VTLTIQTTEDTQRQMTLTIEVDETRVQKAMQQKARELGREVRIPGFRPGKAPFDVIVRRIGEETLRAEAIEDLIQPVFEEALNQADIDPYAQPMLEDIKPEPLVLTFTVPLPPQVTLGDYRSHRKEIEPVEVTDEAVEEALEYVRVRHQVVEPVDRPAEVGDVVTLSGSGKFTSPKPVTGEEVAEAPPPDNDESEVIFDEERLEVLLDEKTLFHDTPFVENIAGMSVGDEKSFSFSFPDPYEQEAEYAGREAQFEVTLLEVKKRDLPPLDDDLAKLEGKYETLEDLRTDLEHNLARQAEDSAKEALIEEMIDHLLEDATVVYPPASVEMQIDEMVEDFKNRLSRSGWEFKDYLNLQGLTEESLREDFQENAGRQVRRQLALRQFILDEKLRVEMAEIDNLIEERIARFDNEGLRESMRNYYRSGQGLEMISSEVLSNQVYGRITDILSGNAPDLSEVSDDTDLMSDEEE
jgi:trigger factor